MRLAALRGANIPTWGTVARSHGSFRVVLPKITIDRSAGLVATLVLHVIAVLLVVLEVPARLGNTLLEPRMVIWIVAPTVVPEARAAPASAAPIEPVTEPVAPPVPAPSEDKPLPTEEASPKPPQAGDIAGTEARLGGGHGDPFAGAAPSGHYNTAAIRPTVPAKPPGPVDDLIALAALKADVAALAPSLEIEIIVQVDGDGVVLAARDLRGSIKPELWQELMRRLVGRRLFHASDVTEPVWRFVSLAVG